MNTSTEKIGSMEIDTSGYYLCEGIWLKHSTKRLIDENNPNQKTLNITDLNDQILILEREVSEWIFHPMITLISEDYHNQSSFKPFKNAIFILFGIFSYIEKMQRYKIGNPYKTNDTNATNILCEGFQKIFNIEMYSKKKIKKILEATRHTMMHQGMVGNNVLLNYAFDFDIEYNQNIININPKRVLEKIAKDFDEYIEELKHGRNNPLIENFQNVFNDVYGDEITKLEKQNNSPDERII